MSSVRNRRHLDDGFTLVEVLVALTLLGVVAAAILPLLLIGARASTVVRFETIAKNLVQERLEQMRQLPFQVDRQNGPFIDLLDYYYPGRTPAASAAASGWVSAASTARSAGEPSGAFYRVAVPAVPGYAQFSQVIAAQFLGSDRTPVAEGTFTTYASQTAGLDGPPSSYLGVTVITRWNVGGAAKQSVVYTEISNPGSTQALISSQAAVTTVRLQATDTDQKALSLVAGRVTADGRLSDGSAASVRAVAAEATREGAPPLRGAYVDVAEPNAVVSGSLTSTHQSAGPSGCGFAGFGHSANSGLTPSIVGGLPRLPSTVGTSATTPAATARATLGLNSGGSCGSLSFDNGSSGAYDPNLRLANGVPLVSMPDVTSGTVPAVDGSAWLNATAQTASPRFVSAGASGRTGGRLGLLPVTFAEDGLGLLGVRLFSASIACSSSGTAVSASYQVQLDVYTSITVGGTITKGRTTLADVSWTSGSGPVPPVIDMEKVVYSDGLGTTLRLKHYFTDLDLAKSVTITPQTGAGAVDAVFRASTTPVRGVLAPESGVQLQVGALSCSAVDAR